MVPKVVPQIPGHQIKFLNAWSFYPVASSTIKVQIFLKKQISFIYHELHDALCITITSCITIIILKSTQLARGALTSNQQTTGAVSEVTETSPASLQQLSQ